MNAQNFKIGGATIYTQVPRYVEVGWVKYWVKTPFDEGVLEVSGPVINAYGEALAVPMTAWGDLRERHPEILYAVSNLRHAMRKQFIEACTYARE